MALTISEILRDTAASLYLKAATAEELLERDFMKGRNLQGTYLILDVLEQKGWAYQKGEVYHIYKWVAKLPQMSEYELI